MIRNARYLTTSQQKNGLRKMSADPSLYKKSLFYVRGVFTLSPLPSSPKGEGGRIRGADAPCDLSRGLRPRTPLSLKNTKNRLYLQTEAAPRLREPQAVLSVVDVLVKSFQLVSLIGLAFKGNLNILIAFIECVTAAICYTVGYGYACKLLTAFESSDSN